MVNKKQTKEEKTRVRVVFDYDLMRRIKRAMEIEDCPTIQDFIEETMMNQSTNIITRELLKKEFVEA